jgi:hypothetical protein
MKNNITKAMLLIVVLFSVAGCEAIGDIFKAGMGFGIFIIVVIIAIIALIIGKLGGNK